MGQTRPEPFGSVKATEPDPDLSSSLAPAVVVFSTSTPWGVLMASLETWGLGGEKTDRDGAHNYPGSSLTTVESPAINNYKAE